MYVYKFEKISSGDIFGGIDSMVQRSEDWVNQIAKDDWELVSVSHTPMYLIVAVRKLVESPPVL